MIEIFATMLHLCASCANAGNTIPGSAGALGGAAGAAGGLGGVGLGGPGLGSGGGSPSGNGAVSTAGGDGAGAAGSSGSGSGNQGNGGGQGSVGGEGPTQSIDLPPMEMTLYPGGWIDSPNGDGTITNESPTGKTWTGPDYQPSDPQVADPNAPQIINLPPVEETLYPGGWIESPNEDGTITNESPTGKTWTGPDYQPGDPHAADPNAPQIINLPPVKETLYPGGWIESPNEDGTITNESPTGKTWTGPDYKPGDPQTADPNATQNDGSDKTPGT